MALLLVAALIWVVLHIGVAGTRLRAVLAARVGDNGFRGIFSVVSVAALAFLVSTWRHAPLVVLWTVRDGWRYPLAGIMLLACIAFVGAFMAKNPTSVGGETGVAQEPRGILRITRHPMLWSFGLWGMVHLVANGGAAALLFFGSLVFTSFAGMPSIDAKVARRSPAEWPLFARQTSVMPFGAILSHRNRFVLGEGLPIALAGGIILWAALLWFHPAAFGVSALPA